MDNRLSFFPVECVARLSDSFIYTARSGFAMFALATTDFYPKGCGAQRWDPYLMTNNSAAPAALG